MRQKRNINIYVSFSNNFHSSVFSICPRNKFSKLQRDFIDTPYNTSEHFSIKIDETRKTAITNGNKAGGFLLVAD